MSTGVSRAVLRVVVVGVQRVGARTARMSSFSVYWDLI